MSPSHQAYPAGAGHPARDAWVTSRRPARLVPEPSPDRPVGWLVEKEPMADGRLGTVLTVFLTSRECPWKCVMCDLWRHTTRHPIPAGAVPLQIRRALEESGVGTLPGPRLLKLYNAGSFFDAGAVPPVDYPGIAELTKGFEQVVVESHPALLGRRVQDFARCLREVMPGNPAHPERLEVAMGLESAHPQVLELLNKRITPADYHDAGLWLRDNGFAHRSFILVGPPFLGRAEGFEWTCRSIAFAFDAGAGVVSLIPTRSGNGALDALAAEGVFAEPDLGLLEGAVHHGLGLGRGRVFADLWEARRFGRCPGCLEPTLARLARMNLEQRIQERPRCAVCGVDHAGELHAVPPAPPEP